MIALSVIGRGILFLARHPYTRAAFRAALRAGTAELIRHTQHHLRFRKSNA